MKNIALLVLFVTSISHPKSFGQKIHEIYPSGGAGGTYDRDAIILQGPPNQSLNGWSLQYAGAASNFGSSNFNFLSTHSFNSQGYFYFETGTPGAGGPLPFVPNANFGFPLSNNGGKLALVNNQTSLSGTCPLPNANIIDFVGYSGTNTANCSEGTPVAWNGSTTNSMVRIQDTGNNSVDFIINTNPLPIELTDFETVLQKSSVLIKWATASERNNAYFSIERSADGNIYESIGTKDGASNSSTGERYTFTDEAPLTGNNYYRLQQVDEDGKFTYSPVRFIRYGHTNQAAVYPNPSTAGTVNLQYVSTFEGALQTVITDGLGRALRNESIDVNKGENQIPVSTSGLPEGVYWMKITAAEETQVIPLIIK